MDSSSTQRVSSSEAAAALDLGINTVVGSVSSRHCGVHGWRLHRQWRRRRGTVVDDRFVLGDHCWRQL